MRSANGLRCRRCGLDLGGDTGADSDWRRFRRSAGMSGCRGMLRHIEMQHLATAMFQHQEQEREYEQHLHRDRGHGEEIDRNHLAEVIVEKGLPALAWRPRQFPEDAGDST